MLNKILTQTHGLSSLQVPEAVQVSIMLNKIHTQTHGLSSLQVPEPVQVSIC